MDDPCQPSNSAPWEQLEITEGFKSDGQMEFDMGKCQLVQRVKGQLSVTDRFTVHEDQILKSSVQRILEGLGFAAIIRD